MLLEIKGKKYEFKFGVKFVREVDLEMPIETNGISFGLGLASKVIPELQSGNINTLSNILVLSNKTEKDKITQSVADDFVDECEDIEKVFDEVLKELSESNSGKLAMKNFRKNLKEQK